MPTHYEVLGVAEGASADEIRRAYLRLARAHHPDAVAGSGADARADADSRIRAVNAAWTVLGHPARRRAYDLTLGVGRVDEFQPFDDGDDEPDPRFAPDVPYDPRERQSSTRRIATLAPMLLVAASVGSFSVAMVVGSAGLLAVAVALLLLAGAMFVLIPLVYMSDARRHG